MKTMIIGVTAVLAMVASAASVFANVHGNECDGHKHDTSTIHLTLQGKNCRGTVGCSCPGFAPITNGDLWEQAYCKHCNHKRMYH